MVNNGQEWFLMVNNGLEWLPEMENVCITMERSTMLLMGKLTISMAMFNSYGNLPEGM